MYVIIKVEGNTEHLGIWVHHDIVMNLTQWLSPKFAVWARNLSLNIKGDFQALTAEAEEAQKQLQIQWQQIGTMIDLFM